MKINILLNTQIYAEEPVICCRIKVTIVIIINE